MLLQTSQALALAFFLMFGSGAVAAGQNRALDCNGLPRLDVLAAPGFCLGLVAEGLKAPRGVLPLPGGDIVVADMGSWEPGHGRVWRLKRSTSSPGLPYSKTLLFGRLDRPNGIALGPDGNVYVTTVGRIARFSPAAAAPVLVNVIGPGSDVAPLPGRGRHLLSNILFDAEGNLIVGVGSASDHCEKADGSATAGTVCAERTGTEALAVIRRYHMQWPAGKAIGWEVYARGLRNSMAMAVDPRNGKLWQGENSRDAINVAIPSLKNDDDLPHDEINLIASGGDYGWPYCYDNALSSPEYPATRCGEYRSPARLLPAHAAPLGMAFYVSDRFPASLRHSLLITHHGYRKHGHRVVALLDKKKAGPFGASIVLVDGKRGRPKGLGAPVGIAVGADGDVYISDDHDGIVVALHYEGARTARE